MVCTSVKRQISRLNFTLFERNKISMKKAFALLCFCLCSAFIFTTQALAATKDYVVAPFKINGSSEYNYLQQAIPSMLASRLFWSGNYETSTKQDTLTNSKPPTNRNDAEKILKSVKADYIFTGNVTILGTQASIDVTALSESGQQWQNSKTANIDNLINELQGLADEFSAQVFNRKVSVSSNQVSGSGIPLSGDFVVNETGNNSIYLNPSFRYQGQEGENRLRSQTLPFAAVSMDMGDITGDGEVDVVFAEDGRMVYLYSWNGGAMKKLAEYQLPSSTRTLTVRTFQQGGKTLVALSTFSDVENRPLGTILEYTSQGLEAVATRIPYYLNTTVIPGTSRSMLIAQSYDSKKIYRGPVFELYVNGEEYTKGPTLPNLPSIANVFNFAYLPDSNESAGYKVVILSKTEKLVVFSSTGSRLYETDEIYSGGNAYISTIDGELKTDNDSNVLFHYIPMRMLSMDLDRDGKSELLANKPISTAASIFKNFRNYPQGEISSLIWDGVGLSLLWKTKRIKGTVADFSIADPNSDGIKDLISCVVTYPGALGLGERKTILTLYPLDTTQTDPNTPANYSE